MSTNYYKVLGIDQKNSTTLDIRKAYKNLALKFHPDKNNNTGAEEKFKLILEAHNVLIDPVKRAEFDQKLKNYKLKCSMCFATFAFNADLAEHQGKCHPKKPIMCAYCSATFVTNAKLAEHQSRKCHSKHFKCTYCNANFAVYDFLEDHQRKCHPKEPFKCTYCSTSYSKSEELIEHVSQIHQFKCGLCPKFFGDFDQYAKHIRELHRESRCDECQAVFHLNQCGVRCDAALCRLCYNQAVFLSVADLHIHKFLKHQKEFEFICSICTAAFAKSEELIQHSSLECTPNMPIIEKRCEQCRSWHYIKKNGQDDKPYYLCFWCSQHYE